VNGFLIVTERIHGTARRRLVNASRIEVIAGLGNGQASLMMANGEIILADESEAQIEAALGGEGLLIPIPAATTEDLA
jgi:hypothetical protein